MRDTHNEAGDDKGGSAQGGEESRDGSFRHQHPLVDGDESGPVALSLSHLPRLSSRDATYRLHSRWLGFPWFGSYRHPDLVTAHFPLSHLPEQMGARSRFISLQEDHLVTRRSPYHTAATLSSLAAKFNRFFFQHHEHIFTCRDNPTFCNVGIYQHSLDCHVCGSGKQSVPRN